MRLWFRPAFAGAFFGGLHGFGRHGWHARWHRHQAARWRDPAAWQQRAVQRVGDRLGLDEAQREAFAALLQRLHAQREALRGASDWRLDLRSLVQDDTFDRWRAEDLLHARVQALREQGPQVIAALAGFYDRLDARQQQAVRQWLDRWGLPH
ncbi:MAG: Spy/CpxP family protein refolding chaperone [Pseudomonadota bacterium]